MGRSFKYRRILLKLSGEALVGDQGYGVDPEMMSTISKRLKELHDSKIEIAVVVGGGNIFRGISSEAQAIER
ncbi:MAG: UMP kinase, partial [Terriglobia bacterium]